MPRAATLKVYRTAIGFHDAYVAAPSQKAALKAWGSDKDLFARGAAELVTERELIAQPLASPGKVIKLLRGTEEEQLAALPPDTPKFSKANKQGSPRPSPKVRAKPSKPRPSRSALDAAERWVAEVEAIHAEQIEALAAREAALAKERRMLEHAQTAELDQVQRAHERETAAYEEALARWSA
jgi:hypothetical protein